MLEKKKRKLNPFKKKTKICILSHLFLLQIIFKIEMIEQILQWHKI